MVFLNIEKEVKKFVGYYVLVSVGDIICEGKLKKVRKGWLEIVRDDGGIGFFRCDVIDCLLAQVIGET